MFDKALWYDWFGLNKTIFMFVNGIHDATYDTAMILISQLADYHHFPVYIGIFTGWSLLAYLYRKITKASGAAQSLVRSIGVILVLGVGFAAQGIVVKMAKEHFEYPRPYVAIGPQEVVVLDYKKDPANDNHSFPSGHVSFATLLVIALWPVLNVGARFLGLAAIFAVCWSRMAMGMHFPADVWGAFLICLIITNIVRMIIYRILLSFKLKC